MRHIRNTLVLMALAGGGLLTTGAWAQQESSVTLSGPTAFDNLGAATGQPPGSMVSRGVGRALSKGDDGFDRVLTPEITETEPRRSVGDQFLVDSVPTIADEISSIILTLINQWFARAGLGELVPDISQVGSLLDEPPDESATPTTTVRPTRPARKTR